MAFVCLITCVVQPLHAMYNMTGSVVMSVADPALAGVVALGQATTVFFALAAVNSCIGVCRSRRRNGYEAVREVNPQQVRGWGETAAWYIGSAATGILTRLTSQQVNLIPTHHGA